MKWVPHNSMCGIFGCHGADAASKVYQLLGAENKLVVRHPDCSHDFPPEVRMAAYDFLAKALAGEEN